MARARGKITLRCGVPQEAMEDLEMLAPLVGKSLGRVGIKSSAVAAWAVQYVLSLEPKQRIKAIQAGIVKENEYLGHNPGLVITVADDDGHGPHSGPIFRGGIAQSVSGKPVPRKIDSGTKRRTKQAAAAALELA